MNNTAFSRRQLLAAMGIAGAGMGLAACAGTSSTSAGNGAKGDPKKIIWWSNHPANSKEYEQELIKRFEAKNPDLKVELIDAGKNYQEVSQKFNAALTGNDLPDVVVLADTEWFNFAMNKATANIDDVAKRNNIDTSTYVTSLYDDYKMKDGHYGMPFSRSTCLFYYNADVWQKAGLPDRGPESWDEFTQWAPKIQEAMGGGNKHAMGWANSAGYLSWTFEGPMWSMGAHYSTDWDSKMTSDATVKSVEWLKKSVSDGWATISTDVTNEFATGLLGCCIQSTGDMSSIKKAAKFPWRAAALPSPKGDGACPTGGAGLSIPAKISEERQNNAVKFIDFITSPENTAYWSRSTGYMPVRKTSADVPEHAQFIKDNPQYAVAVNQLPHTRVQDNYRVLLPNGNRIIGDQLEAVCTANKDVKQALKEAEDQLKTTYDRDVKPHL